MQHKPMILSTKTLFIEFYPSQRYFAKPQKSLLSLLKQRDYTKNISFTFKTSTTWPKQNMFSINISWPREYDPDDVCLWCEPGKELLMVTRQGSQMGGDPSSQLRIGVLLIDFYGVPPQ